MTQNPLSRLADFVFDPLGYVLWAFDWGMGDLRGEDGPEEWQKEVLSKLGQDLKKQSVEGGAIRVSVKSGHGVGKSCLMSWLIMFFMSTRPDIQVIATANTESQLKTKLWRELAKWHRRALNASMFEWSATQLKSTESPEDWYATAIPWNENNPEAMAGAHDKTVLYLFDEASGIHEVIWETAEGALTDGGGVFMAFGNPTKNTGRFYDTFSHKDISKFWGNHTVNCESVDRVDKQLLKDWRDMYGADSDFYRVRCLGEFPKHGTKQFIPLEVCEEAAARRLPAEAYEGQPLVLGVDVARFGEDRTVFTMRQGPKLLFQEIHKGLDTQQTGMRAAQFINQHAPEVVFVDDVGLGAGVTDFLRHSGFRDVIGVNGSNKSRNPDLHRNLRGDCWQDMKDWLKYADIPDEPDLIRDLTVIEYEFDTKMRFILDSKEVLRKRGEKSPDLADSLALTFASPVSVMDFYDDEYEEDEELGASPITGY